MEFRLQDINSQKLKHLKKIQAWHVSARRIVIQGAVKYKGLLIWQSALMVSELDKKEGESQLFKKSYAA